jgi:hypothetical protein
MARNSNVSPELAAQLADIAREARREIFGGNGVPVWGTRFSEIEAKAMAAGMEFARQLMEQAVSEQATVTPPVALDTGGEIAKPVGESDKKLNTGAGEVEWNEPKCYLNKSRRSFFPSSPSAGD